MRNKRALRGLQTVSVVLTNIGKGRHQEKPEEDFRQLCIEESNQTYWNSYLSHVSVGSELHIEMLTENCLLK